MGVPEADDSETDSTPPTDYSERVFIHPDEWRVQDQQLPLGLCPSHPLSRRDEHGTDLPSACRYGGE
jgi:hypothetical protein